MGFDCNTLHYSQIQLGWPASPLRPSSLACLLMLRLAVGSAAICTSIADCQHYKQRIRGKFNAQDILLLPEPLRCGRPSRRGRDYPRCEQHRARPDDSEQESAV